MEEGGGTDFPAGSRVMFWGTYGAFEDGAYSEWIAVRKEDLCLIPDNVDDVSAAGIPVAYLTAQVALTLAGFRPGKTVLAPAIRRIGRQRSDTTGARSRSKTRHIEHDQPCESRDRRRRSDSMRSSILLWKSWADGVRRITDGYGADIVIDGIGGEVLSEAVKALAPGGKPHNTGIFRKP